MFQIIKRFFNTIVTFNASAVDYSSTLLGRVQIEQPSEGQFSI